MNLFVENYYTVEEVVKIALRTLGIDRQQWVYFGIYDSILKSKSLDERLLNERMMIGDVVAAWEIILKNSEESIRSTKLVLGFKFFPVQEETIIDLLPLLFYAKVYDIYFHKGNVDRFEAINIWALCMQADLGTYEEKPGVANRVKNYFHPFFLKYYNDEGFINGVLEAYKDQANLSRAECMQKFIGVNSDDFAYPTHSFLVTFKSSNNPSFKDLQENLVLNISRSKVALFEEVSRENIMVIKLDEIMNWGINDDIICICYGDKYEMIKLYFKVYDPFIVAEILFNYGNLVTTGEVFDYLAKNEHLEKFVVNHKKRRSMEFKFK